MVKIAVNNIKNWIFVTGVVRSGSTFVGTVLSLPREVDYIHEPFNPSCGIPGMNRRCFYVRPSLDTAEMQLFHHLTQSIFSYDFTLKNNIPSKDPWSRKLTKVIIGSRGPFYLRLAKLNFFHQAAVIKDPTGNMLAEFLYVRFGVKPVIVIKHPISFIVSLRRVNWWPKLNIISSQPHLVKDYFSEELDFTNREYTNPVLEASAYWRAIYKVLLAQANKYPDWHVFTHEELSQDPVDFFYNLYQNLDLPWSESVRQKIIKLTQGNHSARARQGIVQDLKRNSADIFKMSLESVSRQERREIFDIVQDVALQIYPKESFALD